MKDKIEATITMLKAQGRGACALLRGQERLFEPSVCPGIRHDPEFKPTKK
jgi:hypothetical protein